jgi:hypothetical protein
VRCGGRAGVKGGLVTAESYFGVTLDGFRLEIRSVFPTPQHGCVGQAKLIGSGDLGGVPTVDAGSNCKRDFGKDKRTTNRPVWLPTQEESLL